MFFDNEPLQQKPTGLKKPERLTFMSYAKKSRYFVPDNALQSIPVGSAVVFDIEIFRNYCLFAFKHIESGLYFYCEGTPDNPLNASKLQWIMWRFKLIGFNSRTYDMPICVAAMKGGDCYGLKEMSDAIILRDERLDKDMPAFNHIDIIEVNPLIGSLKLYAARLHCERMQELPVDPHKLLTPEEIENSREYCFNDLDNTELNYLAIAEQITMRESIGGEIQEDLRSKSDAQIAEAYIAHEYKKITGKRPFRTEDIDKTPVTYTPPSYVKFRTPLLQNVINTLVSQKFEIDDNGYIDKQSFNFILPMGNNVYRMSIGGLHSSETCVSLRSNDVMAISDFDVASYYPKIILNGGKAPLNMADNFIPIYKAIVDRRLAAKAAKRTIESDGLKITINGTFGKFGNSWSIMYSPELMLYVTLTGQLTLLMLIEHAVQRGFEVVSANTDGVVFHYPRNRETELALIVSEWEQRTSFEMEKTEYVGYFARDVNNYMTLKASGEWKLKGAYSEKGSAQNSILSRNPENFICVDAVKAFINKGTPINETIETCRDWRRFVCVRNVTGGAHKNGLYLGKVIRWYYAKGEQGEINKVKNGHKVPGTDGAKPFMQASSFPEDIDYDWYNKEALGILRNIGYIREAQKQERLI